jgi:methyl-accepting chemotaxis protein
MAGFNKAAIDESEDWSQVERYNVCLGRLLERRKSEIVVEGPLLQSKTAWKCAVLQQSLLYRITLLAKGCADAWNAENIVCSVLAARALLETVALAMHISERLEQLMEEKKVAALDDLANEILFSTRNDEVVEGGFGHRATNVLGFIDKLERKMAGIRESYEFLSEWCHPNASGHLFTYGEMNTTTGHVGFFDVAPRVRGILGHVVTCFMMILFVELVMDRFDNIVATVPTLPQPSE